MDLAVVSNIIAGNGGIQHLSIDELEKLVDKYPYSQIFTILYLNAVAKSKPIDFNETLEKYAYRVTDRMRLYEIIHQVEEGNVIIEDSSDEIHEEENSEESITVETIVPEVESFESIEETDESEIIINYVETTELDQSDEEPVDIDSETIIESGISTEIETASIDEVQFVERDDSPVISEVKEELSEIVVNQEENVSSNNEVEKSNADTFESETPISIEEEVSSEEMDETDEFLSDDIEEEVQEEEQEVEEEKMDVLEKSILSSAASYAYIQQLEQEVQELERQKEKEIHSIEIEVDEIPEEKKESTSTIQLEVKESSFVDWLNKGSGISTTDFEKQEVEKLSQDNPAITERQEFYSPIKKAKESLSKDTLIYSETLASIYELQGNFSLAIEAYEQLCLSNPKKRIIFAKKIESLKEKLTNLK